MPKDIEWWLWVRSNYSMTSSTQAPKCCPFCVGRNFGQPAQTKVFDSVGLWHNPS